MSDEIDGAPGYFQRILKKIPFSVSWQSVSLLLLISNLSLFRDNCRYRIWYPHRLEPSRLLLFHVIIHSQLEKTSYQDCRKKSSIFDHCRKAVITSFPARPSRLRLCNNIINVESIFCLFAHPNMQGVPNIKSSEIISHQSCVISSRSQIHSNL